MNGILYLLQVNLYLIAFYAFYRLLLSKETFFGLNRGYLIGSTLLSFGIPVFQSDWLKEWLAPQQVQEVAQQLNYQTYEFITATPTAEVISMADILVWIYFTVVGILLIRLIYRLIKAYRWVKNPENNLQACSFFNYIAVDEDLEGREAIMVHEQIHVQQGHSADVIFFELNTIVNWFNPVAYLYKKEIRKVHEYIADEVASETLTEKSAYAMLLFHENFGLKAQDLTNSFFNQSILKQRIMMLQKNKSKRSALLKYGFTAPLFLGMLVVSSAFVSEKSTQQVVESVLTDTIQNPAIPPSAPKPEAPKKALKTGIKADDNLIYIVNGKELSAAEVRKIDKNKIVTIEIKGPEKDHKKSVMVMNLKPANANGDSSVIKRNDTKGIDNNKPLIVIDGKVMEAGFDMNSIKPNDIASISILKDKSATAVYGEKGKNGVMEITLKKKN